MTAERTEDLGCVVDGVDAPDAPFVWVAGSKGIDSGFELDSDSQTLLPKVQASES